MRKVSKSRKVIGRFAGSVGVVERPVELFQHPAVGQLGQYRVDRIVQPQLAFLDEDHRRAGGDRLCHRGDAENRVALDRIAAVERFRAERLDMGLTAAADQRDKTGHLPALDEPSHHLPQTAEPGFRRACRTHQG